MNTDITFCPACFCMTRSFKKGRCQFVCGKCEADKTELDLYQEKIRRK